MGHRLSKIYTRTGDDGTTGLGDGSRVAKDSLRVDAYGTIDEMNSHLGLVLAYEIPTNLREALSEIQHFNSACNSFLFFAWLQFIKILLFFEI